MSERLGTRIARLEAGQPKSLEAEALAMSPETRRGMIAILMERLGPAGVRAALRRGGAEGRRLAGLLGVAL